MWVTAVLKFLSIIVYNFIYHYDHGLPRLVFAKLFLRIFASSIYIQITHKCIQPHLMLAPINTTALSPLSLLSSCPPTSTTSRGRNGHGESFSPWQQVSKYLANKFCLVIGSGALPSRLYHVSRHCFQFSYYVVASSFLSSLSDGLYLLWQFKKPVIQFLLLVLFLDFMPAFDFQHMLKKRWSYIKAAYYVKWPSSK